MLVAAVDLDRDAAIRELGDEGCVVVNRGAEQRKTLGPGVGQLEFDFSGITRAAAKKRDSNNWVIFSA